MRIGDTLLILARSPAATPVHCQSADGSLRVLDGTIVTGSREAPGLPHFKKPTVPLR